MRGASECQAFASLPSGFGISTRLTGFGSLSPVQQLLPNGRPVLLQIVAELIDRHPVDARATFVALHLPQCFLQVCSFTYVLHEFDSCWLGVRAHSPPRAIRCLPAPPAGLHPSAPIEKSSLNWIFSRLSLSRFMSYLPLLSFGPSAIVSGSAYLLHSTFRRRSASLALPTTWPTMPSADFCPAVRPPYGALSRRSDTAQISWGKLSRLPCTVAGSTLRILDGYGLRGKWPARPTLAPYIRFLSIDSHVCSTLPSDLASRRQPLRCR